MVMNKEKNNKMKGRQISSKIMVVSIMKKKGKK